SKLAGYTVYTKGNDEFFISMLDDFLHCQLTTLKVFRNVPDTKVTLVEKEGKLYVLKVFVPQEKSVERFFKSFFKGDYFLTLFKQTAMLRQRNITFPNDFYLLAETKIFNYVSRFIMIIEYI
ncbi:lipopolysaccharide core heptose(II) kinase RfaY, partial [Rosenbergiella nectarea]